MCRVKVVVRTESLHLERLLGDYIAQQDSSLQCDSTYLGGWDGSMFWLDWLHCQWLSHLKFYILFCFFVEIVYFYDVIMPWIWRMFLFRYIVSMPTGLRIWRGGGSCGGLFYWKSSSYLSFCGGFSLSLYCRGRVRNRKLNMWAINWQINKNEKYN